MIPRVRRATTRRTVPTLARARFDGLTAPIRNADVHNEFQLTVDLVASVEAWRN
jgi:hypothetical protein